MRFGRTFQNEFSKTCRMNACAVIVTLVGLGNRCVCLTFCVARVEIVEGYTDDRGTQAYNLTLLPRRKQRKPGRPVTSPALELVVCAKDVSV